MKDLDDFNFHEQAELMNILNNFKGSNQIQKKQSIGFNAETLYNFIEQDKNR